MIVMRNERKAGPERERRSVLRWLTVALVLIALGLAGVPKADAHSLQHHFAHGDVSGLHDFAAESEYCCDEAEPGQSSEACSVLVHCIGCTVESAAVSSPALSPAAPLGLRLTILPASRATGPAGRPPKPA
jgi:hypothetical protein